MKKLILLAVLSSCSLIREFPDSPIEQALEGWIDEETGIEVDFSGDNKAVTCVFLVETSF